MYFVYVLTCEDGSLYSGITTDVKRRFRQHRGELKGGARYTKSHRPTAVAAVWSAPDRAGASRLEYYLHHISREEKLSLFHRHVLLPKTGECFSPVRIEENS